MTITTAQIDREGIADVSQLWLRLNRDHRWTTALETFQPRGEVSTQRVIKPHEITEALLDVVAWPHTAPFETTVTLQAFDQNGETSVRIWIEYEHARTTFSALGREF